MPVRTRRSLFSFSTAILLIAGSALAGCDAGGDDAAVPCAAPPEAAAGPVTVQTDCAAYAPADSLVLSFRNASGEAQTYGTCGVSLERRVGSGWEGAGSLCEFEVPEQTDDVFFLCCEARGRSLRPGRTSSLRFFLRDGLRAGVYRVRAPVRASDAPAVDVVSNAFEIR